MQLIAVCRPRLESARVQGMSAAGSAAVAAAHAKSSAKIDALSVTGLCVASRLPMFVFTPADDVHAALQALACLSMLRALSERARERDLRKRA